MEAKTENAYTAVLQLILHLCPDDMDLLRAITDFETGLQNAWERVFNVVVQGCHWHMCRVSMLYIRDSLEMCVKEMPFRFCSVISTYTEIILLK